MSTRTPVQRLLQQGRSPLDLLLPQPQRLAFSTSSRHGAGVRKNNSFQPQTPQMRQPAQRSFDVMKKEQMKNIDQMPNDVGLIPGTFVMPSGSRLPSLFENFKERYALEKFRIWLRIREIAGRYFIGFYSVRPRPDFQTARIPQIAKSLYEDMYNHFASGDLAPLRPKLCETVYQKLESRIAARSANSGMQWTLHKYTASPRVVSHKYLPMSIDDAKDKTKQTTIQQVVVKIQSLQSLKRTRRVRQGGKVVEVLEEGSSAEPKEVTEYLVVQRLQKRGKLGDWMIWGTTNESGIEDTQK